jgi:hypothetical protein
VDGRVPHPGERTRRARLEWIVLAYLAVWAVGMSALDTGYVGHIADDGIYLVTAQSIRDGNGYRLPSRPGDPIARKYPPGFPLAIAAMMKIMPGSAGLASDIRSARIIVAISAAVFLYLSWLLLLRLRMPPAYALVAIAALSLHPTIVSLSSSIMSDVVHAALATAVLLIAMSGWKMTSRYAAPKFFGAGVLAAAAFWVRGNGIVLLPALMAQAELGPRRRAVTAASIAGFMLLIVTVSIFVRHAHGPEDSASYRNEMAAAWSTPQAGIEGMVRNLEGFNASVPPILLEELWSTPATRLRTRFPLLVAVFDLAVCAMLIAGAIRLVRLELRRYAGLWIYAALTLATVLIWPWNLGQRLLLPLFPMIVVVFMAGFTQAVRAFRLPLVHPGRAALAIVMLNAVASFATYSYHLQHGANPVLISDQLPLGRYVAMAQQWVPPAGVVISKEPELISLYAHRQAVPLIEDDDCLMNRYGRWERIQWWMDAAPEREFYLVASPPESDPKDCWGRQMSALFQNPRMKLDVVQRSADVIVARVIRKSDAGSSR